MIGKSCWKNYIFEKKFKNEVQNSQSKYFRISKIVVKYAAFKFQLAIRVCWMDEYWTTNFVSEYQQHPFGTHTHTHTDSLSLSRFPSVSLSLASLPSLSPLPPSPWRTLLPQRHRMWSSHGWLFPRFLSASVQSLFHLEPGCEGLKNLGNRQHDDQHARPY
jgi:hypothetical protein